MEIEVKVSRSRWWLILALGVVLVNLGLLGQRVTPVSREGEALVLTPRLWQRYGFLRETEQQLAALAAVDTTLVTGDLTAVAQAGEQAAQVAAAVAVTAGPQECTPVRESLLLAARAYQSAATASLEARLNPQLDAVPALNTARAALEEAQNQWAALHP